MDIPLNQDGEGGFVAFDILFQPRDVIGFRHLPNYVHRSKIGTDIFAFSVRLWLCRRTKKPNFFSIAVKSSSGDPISCE